MAREKKDRTGETTVAKNGMKMTIIAYRSSMDIDVQFEDGAIRKGVQYSSFKIRNIRHPKEKDRTGETAVATNGMKMTIIAYRGCNDIDVQFEDGAVRENATFHQFRSGHIKHPSEKARILSRVGETSVASNGMKITIIAYRRYTDIDVQFEDGAIRKGVSYISFKKGMVRNPNYNNKYIGKTSIASNGMKITIIAYRRCTDIDVQFEDGAVRKGVQYAAFKIGNISHPKEQERRANLSKARLGKTSIASNGMTMTIVEYNDSTNIIVEFNDECHTRVKTSYSLFKKGSVENPNYIYNPQKKDRTGETAVATNGMKMTIIAYRNSSDIDVQFEDGAVRKHVAYKEFKTGKISHPKDIECRENLSKTRIGETSVATNGMTITIVKYINSQNIIVEFDDKQKTRAKTSYDRFKKGIVKNPHFPVNGKGTYKTFQTQYAYTAPDGSVFFYCECQKCGWKKNLTARELIAMKHECIR